MSITKPCIVEDFDGMCTLATALNSCTPYGYTAGVCQHLQLQSIGRLAHRTELGYRRRTYKGCGLEKMMHSSHCSCVYAHAPRHDDDDDDDGKSCSSDDDDDDDVM